MNKKFPKSARLLHHSHFAQLMKQGSHFAAHVRITYRRRPQNSCPKLGITIARRHGKAHDRNRFKRIVREAFRELYLTMPSDLELNVSPIKNHRELTRLCIVTDLQALVQTLCPSPQLL